MYTVIEGGVTAAAGFQTASTAAGIKYKNRKDMAMIYSEKPCKAAGTFTTNIVKAAPVKWDQKIVKESEYAQAVVINAGIANDTARSPLHAVHHAGHPSASSTSSLFWFSLCTP